MVEQVKPYLEKIKSGLKKVPKMAYTALAVLVVFAAVLAIWMNTRPYVELFTDLNTQDMSSILNYLEGQGITEYRVEGNHTILVPASQEETLRYQLLMSEYPNSGFGYTYSLSTGALSTESERQRAGLYDLQDRMSAVVRRFPGVREAVVTINIGEDQSYVLDSNKMVDASASVYVEMQTGLTLTEEQVAAIRRLVAHSVKGVDIDSVAIEDGYGNTYNSGNNKGDVDSTSSALKLRLEQEYEDKIRSKILMALYPYFGSQNVRVAVNCTVDVSQRAVDSTEVHLPPYAEDGSTGGRGIIGSRIYEYTYTPDGGGGAGGTVGTTTNSDLPEYVEDVPELDGDETVAAVGGETVYDNSRTQSHTVYTAGYLSDCTVSISVNSSVPTEMSVDQIQLHSARAAGIVGAIDPDTGREQLDAQISVLSLPFYEEPPIENPVDNFQIFLDMMGLEAWMLYAVAFGLLLFGVLLAVALVLRRKMKARKQAADEEEGMLNAKEFLAAQAAMPVQRDGMDVMNMQSDRCVEVRQDIRRFTEENPELAAQMIKIWLKGGDENG